ncbi:MAG: hypothetical protein B7Z08_10665 [Sphingomonadales bacterium 32-68-7]|nr:MAG: hypothetical protein B7Z33_12520 [Sphingomonadales bacterium 12-68-11]OYX08132.1 MAG: hypothetical protein B7Z08_10665 [Sphingomonadales bacterium 32-68-7]
MGQAVLAVGGLPESPLDAAATFHAEVLPQARELLNPLPTGEGDHPQGGGGAPSMGHGLCPSTTFGGPPPRAGEEIALIFDPAGHEHRAWRIAAVQELAREAAPARVNGVVGDDQERIDDTLAYLAAARGVTGQLLTVDGKSAETR